MVVSSGSWRTTVARESSAVPTNIAVWSGSVEMYSSYGSIITFSTVTPHRMRIREVSWVPHCRAKVSDAISIARPWSRARVIGRRKS